MLNDDIDWKDLITHVAVLFGQWQQLAAESMPLLHADQNLSIPCENTLLELFLENNCTGEC
jgi:hypothetical protein